MNGLEGLDRLVRTLEDFSVRSSPRIAKAGANAGLALLVKRMRQAVNSAPISPQLKKAARETLSKRLLKKEGRSFMGKAGFGVGKPSRAKREKAAARGGDGTKKGVGISASNIHWFAIGTRQRTLNRPHPVEFAGFSPIGPMTVEEYYAAREQSNDYYRFIRQTGKIEPLLKGVIESAASSAGPAMLEAARQKMAQVFAAEAAKAQKG